MVIWIPAYIRNDIKTGSIRGCSYAKWALVGIYECLFITHIHTIYSHGTVLISKLEIENTAQHKNKQ